MTGAAHACAGPGVPAAVQTAARCPELRSRAFAGHYDPGTPLGLPPAGTDGGKGDACMLFSSLTFLIWFLPAVLAAHALLPARWRNAFLLCASVFFYAWGEIRYVPLVLASMALNYGFGIGAGAGSRARRRCWLVVSVLFNFGALVYFKYAAFFMEAVGLGAWAPVVTMPLGISFYTFQTQGYIVDVFRGKIKPERHPVRLMTFILLFPQLIAGPIVLYTDVRRELRYRPLVPERMEQGMRQFVTGLASKVLLANPLGALTAQVTARAASSAPAMWLATLAGVLQLYFDFAGYSLMAIGIGSMLGFRFPRNFDFPLSARSMRAFWRRWHMTLGTWLRDYVYIPLGGSRGTRARTTLNLLAVWLFSGLWHGADYNHVLWGLWFFVCVALERTRYGAFVDAHPWYGLAYTQLAFLIAWPLFHYSVPADALGHFTRMFAGSWSTDVLYLLRDHAVLLLIAALCCIRPAARRVSAWGDRLPWLRVLAVLTVLALCVATLVNERYNPFIYFRF